MLSKFVSDIKKIENTSKSIFSVLSDFEKLSEILKKSLQTTDVNNPVNDKIKNIKISNDTCIFSTKDYGDIKINIIGKEPYKTLKYSGGEDTPFPFTLWIQLVEKAEKDTRIRITLHTKMNRLTKMMLKKQLDTGINQFTDALCKLPY